MYKSVGMYILVQSTSATAPLFGLSSLRDAPKQSLTSLVKLVTTN